MAFTRHDMLYFLWITFIVVCSYCIALKIYLNVGFMVLCYFGYKYLLKQTKVGVDISGQGVVITGCDTGFGHHAALALDQLGFTVFAGCLSRESHGARTLKKRGSKRLNVVQMDITNDEEVKSVQAYVMDKLPKGGLWAVINNAAINRSGDFELVSLDIMKRVSEVNYWGMLRTTKAFLPLIRKSKGRIINVTSVRGRAGFPVDVSYGPTKWAGEGFSEVLRKEMYRFGVKVIVVEPGNFGGITGMLNAENIALVEKDMGESWAAVPKEVKDVYGSQYMDNLLSGLRNTGGSSHPTVEPVINALVDAVVNCNPQYRYLVQGGSRLLDYYHVAAFLNSFLPESVMDTFILFMEPAPAVAVSTTQ